MGNQELLTEVTQLVNTFFPFDAVERGEFSEAEILESLSIPRADPSKESVLWLMDPIDGTRGFITGNQYACALGKIVDGELVLAVVSSPNIPAGVFTQSCTYNEEEAFYAAPAMDPEMLDCWLVAAVRGFRCRQTRFTLGQHESDFQSMEPCSVSDKDSLFDFEFCESRTFLQKPSRKWPELSPREKTQPID